LGLSAILDVKIQISGYLLLCLDSYINCCLVCYVVPVDGRVGRASGHAWVVSPRRDRGGNKGVCTLEPSLDGRHGSRVTALWRLQCPSKHSPQPVEKVWAA